MAEIDIKEGMKINTVTLDNTTTATSLDGSDIIAVASGTKLKHITYDDFSAPFQTGIDNATPSTVPAAGITTYNVGQSGTYTNFLDGVGDPIVITSDLLEDGIVQLRKENGFWVVRTIPVGNQATINNLDNALTEKYILALELGGLNTNGNNVAATTRARTQGYYSVKAGGQYKITLVNATFGVALVCGYSDSAFVQLITQSGGIFTIPSGITRIRASFQKSPNTQDITQAEIDAATVTLISPDYYDIDGLNKSASNGDAAYNDLQDIKYNYHQNKFELGGINLSNGNDANNNIRLRTVSKQDITPGVYNIENIPDGFVLVSYFRYLDGVFVNSVTGNPVVTITEGVHNQVKLQFSKTNATDVITQEEADAFVVNLFNNNESPLLPYVRKIEDNSNDDPGFDEFTDRIIVGNDLYIVDEDNLQLFSHSMCGNEDYEGNFSIQSNNADAPVSRYFNRDLVLENAMFSDGHSVRISNKLKNTMSLYYKNVNVHKVAKSTLTGKTADVIIIGDSITDGVTSAQAVTPYIAAVLQGWGTNIAYFGTMADSEYKNEGRSSWEYSTLIGRRTQFGTDVYAPSDSTTAPLASNPFIKVATSQQILDHPEWVFECTPTVTPGTGVARELNYTDSQAAGTYAGDYYTLDFARYVQNNLSNSLNPSNKLIVVCALGFNDLNHNNENAQSITDALQGMQVLYDRVKAYRSDAIVAFVPIVIVNEDNNYAKYCSWIEQAITQAASLGAELIPVWQHVDRYLAYNYSTTVALDSPATTVKGTSTDVIHPMVFGAKQYANSVSNYIANKL
jgi:hypothetical protein